MRDKVPHETFRSAAQKGFLVDLLNKLPWVISKPLSRIICFAWPGFRDG
jgi:hypothetical protein